MKVDEDQINRWANPPSETENEKCETAVSQIGDSLRAHFGDSIYLIRQGSHRNRTNVRLDSDVDVAVVHKNYYFPDTSFLSETDKRRYEEYRTPADYSFTQFKEDVHNLLEKRFGKPLVQRKNKCIRVKGNSSRVNADVVPAYEHRRFSSYAVTSAEGIALVTDAGVRILSFPEQHYANGVKKNTETSRAFKSVVRILKNVRNILVENGSLDIKVMPSFFIESLVWNVPPDRFEGATWREDAESVALRIWTDMRDAVIANDYAEVSDLMWLFRGHKRTPKQAEDFMLRAWSYIKK